MKYQSPSKEELESIGAMSEANTALDKNANPKCRRCSGTGEIPTPDRARGGHSCPCTFNKTAPHSECEEKTVFGLRYEIYYDRQTKAWWAFWADNNGFQVGNAVHAHKKEQCLIYLGMALKEVDNENK